MNEQSKIDEILSSMYLGIVGGELNLEVKHDRLYLQTIFTMRNNYGKY